MNILRILAFPFALLFLIPSIAVADELDDLEDEMSGIWIVRTARQSRAIVLRIDGLARRSAQGYFLDAQLGWATGDRQLLEIELLVQGDVRKLQFSSSRETQYDVTQVSRETFEGITKPKGGNAVAITLHKISPEELEAVQKAELNATPDIATPLADVSPSCAAFLGGWTGTITNIGRLWLWVKTVRGPNCIATYAYTERSEVPSQFRESEIRNGVLTHTRDKFEVTFSMRGSGLVVRVTGPNTEEIFSMTRINLSDGTLAKLRAEQSTDTPMTIKPRSDVPEKCAAFFGKWTGVWSYGSDRAVQRLVVYGVDKNCYASYSYSTNLAPRVFYRAEIIDGILTFRCNGRGQAMCSFRRSGDTLSAEAILSGSRFNISVFKNEP